MSYKNIRIRSLFTVSNTTVRESLMIPYALTYGAVDKVLNPVAQDAGLLYRGRPVRM